MHSSKIWQILKADTSGTKFLLKDRGPGNTTALEVEGLPEIVGPEGS